MTAETGTIVGILSDSHGYVGPVRQALALFDQAGVSHILHCGDIGNTDVLDEFVGRPCTMVWGNTDFVGSGMQAYLKATGVGVVAQSPATVTLHGKRFAVFHGHERAFLGAVENLDVDYLLHGHSHQCRDERVGGKRIINPGALHRANPLTVATLDVVCDKLVFHEIGPH